MSNLDRYLALVRSFPVMRFAPVGALRGRVIDFRELETWATEEDADGREGILATVQFLLSVWSSSHPWACGKIDFCELETWATEEDADGREGILATVQFLLNVWSSSYPWACGKFDLFAALNVWDEDQLAAWKAWAADPWRP